LVDCVSKRSLDRGPVSLPAKQACRSLLRLYLPSWAEPYVAATLALDVMFRRTTSAAVRRAYRDIVKPGVTFVQTTVRLIDPNAKRVETGAGPFEADILVVALGADLDVARRPASPRRATTSTPSRAPSRHATCSPPSREAA
jgi:glycine/D-amino acid oxidase-like deaminating enzyme